MQWWIEKLVWYIRYDDIVFWSTEAPDILHTPVLSTSSGNGDKDIEYHVMFFIVPLGSEIWLFVFMTFLVVPLVSEIWLSFCLNSTNFCYIVFDVANTDTQPPKSTEMFPSSSWFKRKPKFLAMIISFNTCEHLFWSVQTHAVWGIYGKFLTSPRAFCHVYVHLFFWFDGLVWFSFLAILLLHLTLGNLQSRNLCTWVWLCVFFLFRFPG